MDHDDGELDDEKALVERVGYGVPPVHTRWKKGQSPNPAGRPRNRKSRRSMLASIAFRDVTYKEGDRSRKTNVISAILLIIKNKAIGQNAAASRLNDQLLGCHLAPDDDQPDPPRGILFVPEKLTVEEWETLHTPDYIRELNREATTSSRSETNTAADSERTRDNDNVF